MVVERKVVKIWVVLFVLVIAGVALGINHSRFWQNNLQVTQTKEGRLIGKQKLEEQWYQLLKLGIQQIASGDDIFLVAVGGLDESLFEIKNGRGQKVGTNRLAFRGYYLDGKDRLTFRLFPVVVTDLEGKIIVNASGWHPEVDETPVDFFKSRLQRGKLLGVVVREDAGKLATAKQELSERGDIPQTLFDQMDFLGKWLEGTKSARQILAEGRSGQVVPVWNFDSGLNGKMIIDNLIINELFE